MAINRSKRIALSKRKNILLRQTLNHLNLFTKERSKYRELLDEHTKQRNRKVKHEYISVWMKECQEELNRLKLLEQYRSNKRNKLFKALKQIVSKIISWKNACECVKTSKINNTKKKVMEIFKARVLIKKDKITKENLAKNKLAISLLRKSIRGLCKIIKFPSNSIEEEEFNARKQVRKGRKLRTKTHFMQVWKSRAQKAMRRAKASTIMMNRFKLIHAKLWMKKYIKEVKFFRMLDDLTKKSFKPLNIYVDIVVKYRE